MANVDSRVTIHMAASLDGFIARRDGSVDWLETSDEFPDGATMDPGFVELIVASHGMAPDHDAPLCTAHGPELRQAVQEHVMRLLRYSKMS
jgi:riboflavin biosynthesis pyrimidine reductase